MTRYTRRALLGSAIFAACGRKRAKRYHGWMFVASGAARGIAVANLSSFQRMSTIPLPHAPDLLLGGSRRVFSLSHEGAELIEVDPAAMAVTARILFPAVPSPPA